MMNDYFSKKSKPNPLSRKAEYKCMNCAKIIEDPTGGPYARRFCSQKCKDEYLGQDY